MEKALHTVEVDVMLELKDGKFEQQDATITARFCGNRPIGKVELPLSRLVLLKVRMASRWYGVH